MDLSIAAMLFAAGIAGGVANAIAGGASLVTFPAMLAAGLPPIVANASNAVAVVPGHLVAAIADRESLGPPDRAMAVAALAVFVGGGAGAVLLMVTPETLFILLVPALVGLATAVFAFAKPIQRGVARLVGGQAARMPRLRAAVLLPTCVYGGYFGAGLGVMLLAVLSITGREDIRAANALKNLLSTVVSAIAVSIFVVRGAVSWPEVAVMFAGGAVGGYLGGRLIRVLPARVVQSVVVTIGSVMTAIYAWRYWF